MLKTCYSAKGGPTLKNYLASNISSAKVEQPCPSLCVPFLVHQGEVDLVDTNITEIEN